MSFNKKYVSNNSIPYINTHDTRSIAVSNIREVPNELKPYLELLELRQYTQTLLEYTKGLEQRLEHVEQFLATHDFELEIQSLKSRSQGLEASVEKMLTPSEEIALKLTSEKEEVRRLGEEISKIKQAMGVTNAS